MRLRCALCWIVTGLLALIIFSARCAYAVPISTSSGPSPTAPSTEPTPASSSNTPANGPDKNAAKNANGDESETATDELPTLNELELDIKRFGIDPDSGDLVVEGK